MKPTIEELLSKLDELLAAKDRSVCRAIDAGACRTATDYRRAREAADAFGEARDAFEADLRAAMGE
jgi:hypothetical protein